MTIITVTKDDGTAITFTDNQPNWAGNFANKTFWQQQTVYTYHRPYQGNHGIIYNDGKDSAECVVRGMCRYNRANLETLESLKGTIVKVKMTKNDGTILEDTTRAYVRNIPQPTPEIGETITFDLELTKVY